MTSSFPIEDANPQGPIKVWYGHEELRPGMDGWWKRKFETWKEADGRKYGTWSWVPVDDFQ